LRSRDLIIPPDEQLYRTVEPDWVDGDTVLALAVDGEGSSALRSAYATIDEALADARERRPDENGVVSTTSALLPIDFPASNNVAYDTFVFDDPAPSYEAHCEIRWRRTSDRPSTDHLKKVRGAAKDELKAAIADTMTVLVPPSRNLR
jgi:hypothetical protein